VLDAELGIAAAQPLFKVSTVDGTSRQSIPRMPGRTCEPRWQKLWITAEESQV